MRYEVFEGRTNKQQQLRIFQCFKPELLWAELWIKFLLEICSIFILVHCSGDDTLIVYFKYDYSHMTHILIAIVRLRFLPFLVLQWFKFVNISLLVSHKHSRHSSLNIKLHQSPWAPFVTSLAALGWLRWLVLLSPLRLFLRKKIKFLQNLC